MWGMKDNPGIFSPEEMSRIRGTTAAVAGLGALGQLAAEEMVRGGFERLILIDGDVFGPENLNRQICADILTLNRPKAEVLAERLGDISPRLKLKVCPVFLDRENGKTLTAGADMILDCVDHIPSKLVLEALAEQMNVPLIHGGVEGWCGQAGVVFPGQKILSALYRNIMENPESGQSAGGSYPVSMPAVGAVASIQAAEAMKLAAGRETSLKNTLLSADLSHGVFDRISILNGTETKEVKKWHQNTADIWERC